MYQAYFKMEANKTFSELLLVKQENAEIKNYFVFAFSLKKDS